MSAIWKPTATLDNIKLRADLLAKIRAFFVKKNVLEVETPLLSHSTNPAPHLQSFTTYGNFLGNAKNLFLQTSPEFAMKRLLASGSGDIYQVCKAFRDSEYGRIHNPEFTILEWYRVGFDHHDLMAEMAEFLTATIGAPRAETFTYEEVFNQFLNIGPHNTTIEALQKLAITLHLDVVGLDADHDSWLQLLFTHHIEPHLGQTAPCFIYDFPASQAMLARLTNDNPPKAARFEVYFKGLELANGFYELKDAQEQRQRFLDDLAARQSLNLPSIPLDENFLAALPQLPDCAGVALGIDRLLMLAANAKSFAEIISFPIEIA